jgi:hypothetical protein
LLGRQQSPICAAPSHPKKRPPKKNRGGKKNYEKKVLAFAGWMATLTAPSAAAEAHAELIDSLKLASFDGLQKTRSSCPNCSKSQQNYCCDCLQLLPSCLGPKIQLPIKLDVIHHVREKRSKSSAVHAAVLAPDDTTFIDYDPARPLVPEYDPTCTLLLFPCDGAKRLHDVDLSKITRVVVVDSTWSQSKIILEHTHLQALPKVALESHDTIFWRYQDVGNQ